MANYTSIRKIAVIGDYLPRKCGIATFSHDVRHSLISQYPNCECIVVPMDDIPGGYDYPPEVRFQIDEQDLEGYRRAADFLNFNDLDVVCLQHEYGIFGGPAGSHILALLRDLRMPVVTTLHTVLEHPTDDQRRVMDRVADRSARLIVMSHKARDLLLSTHQIDEEKIDIIPHGIPDMPFVDPNFFKDQFGVEGKQLLLTFGLLSPNKGIEYAIRALPKIVAEFPDTVYIVLGATHPNLVREQGEEYRLGLESLARELGVGKHVVFYNRFVELRELTEFIGAADIYLTPYLNPAQITSGTLAYAFGCGKAVVSTPYWHATELLAEGRGVLVPFADSDAIAREVCELLRDESRRHAMRKRAYLLGREMIWSNVSHLFMDSFERARRGSGARAAARFTVRTLEDQRLKVPELRLDHLLRLTDSTGLVQHATYTVPNFREGYCTDDNARGLILTVLLEVLGQDTPELRAAMTRYAAFLDYAFDPETPTWRNFMSFDRRWLEPQGSEDSLGRLIWALGTCVGRSKRKEMQFWGVRLFDPALRLVEPTTSPRTWAFVLMGIHEYLQRLSGDRIVTQMRETLTERLITLFLNVADDDWVWFEDIVSYGNARLPHALLLSGHWAHNEQTIDIGLRTLRWLTQIQQNPQGSFRPIGSDGFYRRGETPAAFDQQPIEASAMVSACIDAYRITDDRYWLDAARRAFDWFLGRNDLGLPMVDTRTGGCFDGLHADRVNQNQGAESTLSWLLALAEMKLLEGSLASFDAAVPVNSKSDAAMV